MAVGDFGSLRQRVCLDVVVGVLCVHMCTVYTHIIVPLYQHQRVRGMLINRICVCNINCPLREQTNH